VGKKGGSTIVKRQLAPTFWDIKRKESRFILRVRPGPYSKRKAYPLGIILRDILKVATTMHEAQMITNSGVVKVDGKIRRDVNFAVGLMDVLEIVPTGQAYRFVPKNSILLEPIVINTEESHVKLVRVTSKVTIKGKKLQYGFHDGKTILSDRILKVGDSCLIEIPGEKIIDHIDFKKGGMALITSGENAGNLGRIEDIRDGVFSLPKRVILSFSDRSVELPVEMVMVVGLDKPVIKVN
jgi:small subunit ribosomal protein S4e